MDLLETMHAQSKCGHNYQQIICSSLIANKVAYLIHLGRDLGSLFDMKVRQAKQISWGHNNS